MAGRFWDTRRLVFSTDTTQRDGPDTVALGNIALLLTMIRGDGAVVGAVVTINPARVGGRRLLPQSPRQFFFSFSL